MEVGFTTHALKRMQERKILKWEVENTIFNPNKVTRKKDKWIAIRKRENEHILMVVYTKTDIQLKVVTVIDTSKIYKYF